MNTEKQHMPRSPLVRCLAAAGVAVGLMMPLSASADHQGNDVVQVLASAAVAYVVIDAMGGFDDDDRRYRRDGYRDRRRHGHRARYDRWDSERHHRARWDHGRHHRHSHHHSRHRHHKWHRAGHRCDPGHSRHHRRDRYAAYRASY